MNRNRSVDIARGIGILLVVFGHNWIVLHDKGELYRDIFSFHMPLFFVLAGVYLKPESGLLSTSIARARSLLKPYFVVLTAVGVVYVLAHALRGDKHLGLFGYLAGEVYATGSTIQWDPLWFLPHLFLSTLAALMLVKGFASLHGPARLVALAAAGGIYMIGAYGVGTFWSPHSSRVFFPYIAGLPGLPWSVDLTLLTAPLIALGYLARAWVTRLRFSGVGFALSVAGFAVLHLLYTDTIDLNLRVYSSPSVCTLEAAAGIYAILNLASLIDTLGVSAESLSYLGRGSLFILIFHNFFQNTVFDLASSLLSNAYLCAALSFFVSVVLSVAVLELVKRQPRLARWMLPADAARPRAGSAVAARSVGP